MTNRFLVSSVVVLVVGTFCGLIVAQEQEPAAKETPPKQLPAKAAAATAPAASATDLNQPGVFSSDLDVGQSTLTPRDVEELRKQFPFESVSARLDYEARFRDGKPVPLSAESESLLRKREADSDGQPPLSARAEALQILHEKKVEDFIKADGFGFSRIPRGTRALMTWGPQPIGFDVVANSATAEDRLPPTSRLRDDGRPDADAAASRWLLPPRTRIAAFHAESQQSFAGDWSFGYVVSRDRVAGFADHGFRSWNGGPADDAQSQPDLVEAKLRWHSDVKRWKVTRLELVSLLKHDTPRVYVSEHLPSMTELASLKKTRDLGEFEAVSLGKLRAGEEMQTSSTPNRIEMLGAIRANTQCTRCHSVPRGTLLGAFTYELRRDPPLKLAPPNTQ